MQKFKILKKQLSPWSNFLCRYTDASMTYWRKGMCRTRESVMGGWGVAYFFPGVFHSTYTKEDYQHGPTLPPPPHPISRGGTYDLQENRGTREFERGGGGTLSPYRGSALTGEGGGTDLVGEGGALSGTATLSRLETVLSFASPNRLSSSLIARLFCT